MSDTKKDAAEASSAVITAVLAAGSGTAVVAGIAAAIPGIVSTGLSAIRDRDTKRAESMVHRMLQADEDPAVFASWLNAKIMDSSDDTVTAFRSLLVASLEALSLAALEPVAIIGRAYLRGDYPAWVARAWLRVLTELSEVEIAELRRLIVAGNAARLRLLKMEMAGTVSISFYAGHGLIPEKDAYFLVANPERADGAIAVGSASRLLDLFLTNHLGRLEKRSEEQERQRHFTFRPGAFGLIQLAFLVSEQ